MNSVLYAGPAHLPHPAKYRRALYSLHGCLPRRCQPQVRVQAHRNGKLVGATKPAVRKSWCILKWMQKTRERVVQAGPRFEQQKTYGCGQKKRSALCIRCSMFLLFPHLSFEEEPGEIYWEMVCPPESSERATFDWPMRCRYIPWHTRSWVSCFPTCYKSFITIQLNFSLYHPIPKPWGKFSFLDTSKHFYKCKQAPGGWLQRQEELLYLEV